MIEGDIIALVGDLGSGKTWLTKGLAIGLGVAPGTVITSPSFSLVNEYKGRYPFYHMDLYRLEDHRDILSAGIDHYLYDTGVVAVEWADRWPEILPEKRVWVKLVIIDDHKRHVILSGQHPRAVDIMNSIGEEVGITIS